MIITGTDKEITYHVVGRYIEFLQGHTDNFVSGKMDELVSDEQEKAERISTLNAQLVAYNIIYTKLAQEEDLGKEELAQIVVASNVIVKLMLDDRDNISRAAQYMDNFTATIVENYL